MTTVAVVGAGGLGGPVALTLASRGIGVRLVDDDRVEVSNLQRQTLFRTADTGELKVEAAARRIRDVYPGAHIETRQARLEGPEAAGKLFEGCAAIVDATDDPGARFLINDWSLQHKIPAVIGGIQRFNGLVVAVGPGFGPCFRCLFDPEEVAGAGTCAGIGVVGALAGIVGHLQGEMAYRIVTGAGADHFGRAVTVDAARGRVRVFELPERAPCPACGGLYGALDIRGDRCPFTWVKTRLMLEAAPAGAVLAVTMRRGEPERNVGRNLRDEGHAVLFEGPMASGDWWVVVKRAG